MVGQRAHRFGWAVTSVVVALTGLSLVAVSAPTAGRPAAAAEPVAGQVTAYGGTGIGAPGGITGFQLG